MEMTMSEAIRQALIEVLEGDEPMALLGQDIGPHGGVFGVTPRVVGTVWREGGT